MEGILFGENEIIGSRKLTEKHEEGGTKYDFVNELACKKQAVFSRVV